MLARFPSSLSTTLSGTSPFPKVLATPSPSSHSFAYSMRLTGLKFPFYNRCLFLYTGMASHPSLRLPCRLGGGHTSPAIGGMVDRLRLIQAVWLAKLRHGQQGRRRRRGLQSKIRYTDEEFPMHATWCRGHPGIRLSCRSRFPFVGG